MNILVVLALIVNSYILFQPMSLYIRLFVSWTVRNRNQIQKQRDRQRKTHYEQHQQYSKHTCVVYSIRNKQFTELSPGTTQSFKFIQHCIFYFTFNIITSKITNIHVKFFHTKRHFHATLYTYKHRYVTHH